ncbi:MAG: retropepsin-like aspartic protease family protein [Labrenzia sp.]|uniref:retropepsin-like aspartic protease family protein n=1 Tax=Stappiaceae TaxID=2821832 RepID=UPI001ADA3E6F|nr:TIGR02281 family clan AA aspartic protease [Labrenzia sp. R4_2]MBO9420447.1 TIGR02281 family clan AA aspartic protease [Labrenzia sp. R4_2]
MYRFLIVLVLCAAIAPIVPLWVEHQNNQTSETAAATSNAPLETGERRHRISANRSGQFVADVHLNGQMHEMLVDTGASATVLPVSVARTVGIFPANDDFKLRVSTANGTTYGARAIIDRLQIGRINLRNIEALVLQDSSLSIPLLGMTALNKLDRFDISNGTLVLIQ